MRSKRKNFTKKLQRLKIITTPQGSMIISQAEYFTNFIVSALLIIVNLIEIYLIAKRRRHITTYEALLLSLSFADFLVGVSTVVFTAGGGQHKFTLDDIGSPLFFFTLMSSMLHLSTLTIDRAIAVVYPLKHRYWVSKTRIIIFIISLWVFSLAISLPLVLTHRISTYKKTVFGYFMLVQSGVMVVSYAIIIYIAVIRRRKRLQTSTGNRSNQQGNNMRKDLRLVLMSFTVVLSYTCLTFPFVVKTVTHRVPNYYEKLAFVINSMMNSLVYFFWKFLEQRAARSRKRSERTGESKASKGAKANWATEVIGDKASNIQETVF